MKRVLTIAGSDSSGGAGIQADLKVFAEIGVFGLSAVTAVTAQNSRGVQKVFKVAPRIIAAQIDSVTRDMGVDACKIGMLYTPQVVDIVADRLHRREIPNAVLDPVIFAKDGTRLLSVKAVERMKKALLPRVLLVAPNITEAEILSGVEITDISSAATAAKEIWNLANAYGVSAFQCRNKPPLLQEGVGGRSQVVPSRYVLIKGGHLQGEPIDILFDGENVRDYRGERIEGDPMRGTGCVFTAAIAALLAQGHPVEDAITFAKQFVSSAIEHSIKLGKGKVRFYTGTRA